MASHARACTQGTKFAPVDAAGESPFSFAGMMGGISALASSSVRVDSVEVRVEAGEAADISTVSTDFSLVGTLHVCVCSCMHAFMHSCMYLSIYTSICLHLNSTNFSRTTHGGSVITYACLIVEGTYVCLLYGDGAWIAEARAS